MSTKETLKTVIKNVTEVSKNAGKKAITMAKKHPIQTGVVFTFAVISGTVAANNKYHSCLQKEYNKGHNDGFSSGAMSSAISIADYLAGKSDTRCGDIFKEFQDSIQYPKNVLK